MATNRMDRHTMLMNMAGLASCRSTCSRNAVGVVIALDGRVLVSGYNGAPAGMPHCDHTCPCQAGFPSTQDPWPFSHTEQCPMKPCKRAVHGEANTIAFAARHGVRLNGADLYTTLGPCVPCAQLIINAGIKRVYYDRPYRDASGLELLMAGNVAVIWTGEELG